MEWKILDTGKASAKRNMEIDGDLLKQLSTHPHPVLHFYEWMGNAATFGYFSRPETLLNLEAAANFQLDLAKRPTGGGLVFHFTDFAFSIVVPASHPLYSQNTLENYARINAVVESLIQEFIGNPSKLLMEESAAETAANHFCMGKPTIYDVMIGHCKVAGAAQRRTKHGFLHQGTIHLALPDWEIISQLVKDKGVVESIRKYSAGLIEHQRLDDARKQIKERLTQFFKISF